MQATGGHGKTAAWETSSNWTRKGKVNGMASVKTARWGRGSERRLWYRNTNEGRGGEEEERQRVAQWYPKRSLNDGTDESGLLLAFCIIYLQVHSSNDVRLKLAVREYSRQSSNRGKSHFVSCTSQGARRLTRIGQKFALVWWISDSSVLPFQQTRALFPRTFRM